MAFELPALPYAQDALAPHISAETLEYHYGKHHQTYVTNLNNLTAGTEHENASLEEVIMNSEAGLFNNSAQVWNHTFYWNSMAPNGGGAPTGEVADAIGSAFGGYDAIEAGGAVTHNQHTGGDGSRSEQHHKITAGHPLKMGT